VTADPKSASTRVARSPPRGAQVVAWAILIGLEIARGPAQLPRPPSKASTVER
jgi:hypothetical protein